MLEGWTKEGGENKERMGGGAEKQKGKDEGEKNEEGRKAAAGGE